MGIDLLILPRRLAAPALPDNLCTTYESAHALGAGVEPDQVEDGE